MYVSLLNIDGEDREDREDLSISMVLCGSYISRRTWWVRSNHSDPKWTSTGGSNQPSMNYMAPLFGWINIIVKYEQSEQRDFFKEMGFQFMGAMGILLDFMVVYTHHPSSINLHLWYNFHGLVIVLFVWKYFLKFKYQTIEKIGM